MSITEEWKEINLSPYEKLYMVSNLGEIKSMIGGRILKKEIAAGYYRVSLYCKSDNKSKHVSIHRMVAETFIENKNNDKKIVNHKDGNKLNNCVSNLEWETYKNNAKHALKTGLRKPKVSPIIVTDSDGFIYEYKSQKEMMEHTKIGETTLLRALNTGNKPFGWTITYKNKEDERPYVNTDDFENLLDFPNYKINKTGEIYSTYTKKLLRKRLNSDGYYVVTLVKNKKVVPMLLHRLLGIQFVPNKYKYDIINHIDHNKKNYAINNLEWCTAKQNTQKYLLTKNKGSPKELLQNNSGSDESHEV